MDGDRVDPRLRVILPWMAALLGSSVNHPPEFTGSLVVTSQYSGACVLDHLGNSIVDSPAQVRIAWTLINSDADYRADIYKDGVYVGTAAIAGPYDYSVGGQVEDGTSPTTSNWLFEVRIVHISDSAVVAIKFADATWQQAYGICPVVL